MVMYYLAAANGLMVSLDFFWSLTEEEEEIEMLLENYLQRYSLHSLLYTTFGFLFFFLSWIAVSTHCTFSVRCESCHGQAERLLDSAREMEDSIAVNLRYVHSHNTSSRMLYVSVLFVSSW
jgi:hypothetical protein